MDKTVVLITLEQARRIADQWQFDLGNQDFQSRRDQWFLERGAKFIAWQDLTNLTQETSSNSMIRVYALSFDNPKLATEFLLRYG